MPGVINKMLAQIASASVRQCHTASAATVARSELAALLLSHWLRRGGVMKVNGSWRNDAASKQREPENCTLIPVPSCTR
jgi:hypothetical protein